MTRYYYDCEFHEDGSTIELVSIGIVTDTGRELYAVNADLDEVRLQNNDWLRDNVWPALPHITPDVPPRIRGFTKSHLDRADPDVRPHQQIARIVRDFLLADGPPELWAYYAAYDHVALAQLWGRMIDLPQGIPMHTNDLRQEIVRLDHPPVPEQAEGLHNALADARHLRTMWHAVHPNHATEGAVR